MNLFISSLVLSALSRVGYYGNSDTSECPAKFFRIIADKEMPSDIVKKLGSCLFDINKPIFEREMTPLIFAAKQGNIWAIDLFLQAGADIDTKDSNDLTPLLHAAIQGHEHAVTHLLEKGSNRAYRSKFGGNYADYLHMTSPFRSDNLPKDYNLHNLNIEPQCLGNGVVVTSENVIKPAMLASLLEERSHDYEMYLKVAKLIIPQRLQSHFLEAYSSYKQNPPALSVSTLKATDSGKPIESKICGLFAKERIPQGAIIAEYTGEIKTLEPSEDSTYRVDEYPVTDSIKYRSAASMANHGFPNAYLVSLAEGDFDKGLDGLPSRKLLVAINDISEGQEITWNYGSSYYMSNRIEFRLKALKQFIRTISWKDLIETFKMYDSREISVEQALDAFENVSKFDYFFESPSAVQFAVKNKYLTKAHLDLFKKALGEKSFGPLCRGMIMSFIKEVELLLP